MILNFENQINVRECIVVVNSVVKTANGSVVYPTFVLHDGVS